MHAGVEHADRVDARIGAETERQEASARLAHDGDLVRVDFAAQRRAGARILGGRPIDAGAQIVGRRLAARLAFLRRGAEHEEAVRRDRRQEAAVARGVDRAAAVAPDEHGQRVARRERVEVRRMEDHEPRRAERRPGGDLVGARHRERRAFERAASC